MKKRRFCNWKIGHDHQSNSESSFKVGWKFKGIWDRVIERYKIKTDIIILKKTRSARSTKGLEYIILNVDIQIFLGTTEFGYIFILTF